MRPARGDTKPCIQTACPGVMQYARPPVEAGSSSANEALRWVCSVDRTHTSHAADDVRIAEPPVRR